MPNRFEQKNLSLQQEAQETVPMQPKSQEQPTETAPEQELVERQLSPEEVGAFKNEMDKYAAGLRARAEELQTELAELQKMSAEFEKFARYGEIQDELAELQEQIDGLADSSEAIAEQGGAAVITIIG